jgi:uncharacterized protein involved in exopolysaccharide biosynthesis
MSRADQHQAGAMPTDRGEIDLAALFREVGRAKWFVLGATLAAAVLSTVAVSVLSPRFTAETRILVENRETDYTRPGRDGARGSDPMIDQEQVASQVQIITSRDLARRMIERFDLGSKREFDRVIDGIGLPSRIMVMLGLIDNPANVSPQERVLESWYDKLKAFPVPRSRVLSIEFQSRDPELAAKLSNAIAEDYILQLEAAKKGVAQSAGGWLARAIEPLRQRVAEAEARVEAFRTQNGLFQSGESSTIPQQQLSELNTQLATARAQQAEQSARARNIREAVRQGRIFEVSDVINNEVVRRLTERRAELKAQIAQEERTLLPQHPRIRELNAQLGGLEDQIRAAAERTARALENDARTAGARVAASQAELEQQKRQSGVANEAEVQLRALEREAKAEREQLETYLARFRDASSRNIENAFAADARVISRATVPSAPTFPKRLPIIIIATLAAFTLALFFVLTRALISDRIYLARPPAHAPTPMPAYAPFPMADAQMLQAFYAHQAQLMAQMAAAATPQPSHAARAAEAASPPAPDPARDSPAIEAAGSPQPDPMRASLERMRATLDAPRSRNDADEARERARPPYIADAPSTAMAADDADAGYDPLDEIVQTADAARVSGRPVSILVLSAKDSAYAAGVRTALGARLAARGRVRHASFATEGRSASSIASLVRAEAGDADHLLIDGGHAGPDAAPLVDASAIAVLVAPDDILDPANDAPARNLIGCSYFIVGPQPVRACTA